MRLAIMRRYVTCYVRPGTPFIEARELVSAGLIFTQYCDLDAR